MEPPMEPPNGLFVQLVGYYGWNKIRQKNPTYSFKFPDNSTKRWDHWNG